MSITAYFPDFRPRARCQTAWIGISAGLKSGHTSTSAPPAMQGQPETSADSALAHHAGFRRPLSPDERRLWLDLLLETYPTSGVSRMEARLDAARHAEAIGVIGLRLRDIPPLGPRCSEAGQACEPLTYIAALVGVTRHMTPGT